MKTLNISLMIFQSQPHVEHTLGEKIIVMQNNFTFLETNAFFKCPALRISKINSFVDLKQNKKLLDNKSWELLDTTVRYMHEWLCGWNICTTVELVSWRMKNKTEDYINTCNGRPFHEEKKYFMTPFYGWVQLSQGCRATMKRSTSSCYSFDRRRKDEKMI